MDRRWCSPFVISDTKARLLVNKGIARLEDVEKPWSCYGYVTLRLTALLLIETKPSGGREYN